MWAAISSNDTEAQSIWSSVQSDGLILGWAVGKKELRFKGG